MTRMRLRPHEGLKLPGRLAALAAPAPGIHARGSIQWRRLASASMTPARSLNPSR
jgi:hypothetical protein